MMIEPMTHSRKSFCILLTLLVLTAASATAAHSAVFGGGPLYTYAANHRDMIRASGFSTVILWTIHVHDDGDFVLNDKKIIDDGVYVGRAAWPAEVAAFKTGPTSVNRIEIGIGSWGVADFERIKALIEAQGTGPDSILYKNFQALRNAVPSIDAVNYDDESCYDVASSVALGIMLKDMGFQIALCPYTRSSYWRGVFNGINDARPGAVDRVYLQCYAGGANNNPGTWNGYFGGLKVSPGLWCWPNGNATPAQVEARMSAWRGSHDIAGGFMWLLDDMLNHQGTYPVSAYGHAINDALAFSTHANEVATLFQHINFGGWLADFTVGAHTTAAIVAAGGLDNDASSLILKPGYKAIFYEGDWGQGATLVKTATDATLVDDGWNDRLSSMIIAPIDDPVTHYTFNEATGTSVTDSSGYGRHGMQNNMDASAWTNGKRCGALEFDGIDDYVVVPAFDGIGGTLSRTCTAWIKTSRPAGGIVTWGLPLAGRKWNVAVDGRGGFGVEVGSGHIISTSLVADGQWHHVAAVFENDGTPNVSDIRLYVDGQLETPFVIVPQTVDTADFENVTLGAFRSGTDFFFQGQMDEVRVYTRALTDSEIRDIYEMDALTADVETDGRVNLADLAIFAQFWDSISAGMADLTCDGVVDMDDLAILIEEWLRAI
jgi:hypothetical protein